MNNKEKKEIMKKACDNDNRIQRKLNKGLIGINEFNYRKKASHKEYSIVEKAELELILKKYGGM